MARDLQQLIWQKFVDSLCAAGAGKGLQASDVMAASGLLPANWETMDITGLPRDANAPAPGTVNVPALLQWANVMPSWNPTYVPSSLNFYDQYSAFLNSIALKGGNPALQQIADGYAVNVDNARKKLSKDRTTMMTEWAAFSTAQAALPPGSQTTFAQWYSDNWASSIVADQNALDAQTMKFNQAMQAVGGPDYKTVVAAQTAAALTSASGIKGPGDLLYPSYQVSSSLNAWYVSALQSLTDGSAPAIDFEISLDDSDADGVSTSSYFSAAAAASYGGFCWGGSAAASYAQAQGAQKYDSLVQGLKMNYKAQAAQLFTFTTGPWYTSSMVSMFADQISPTSALGNKKLFGPDGQLNLRTSQALVVLKPSVTLTGSKQQIATLNQNFSQQSAASISVGGFCWSASANASQGSSSYASDSKISNDGTQITITDNTNAPKVVLVVPSKLGPSNAS